MELKTKEETITMTVTDFKKLIADEVEKNMSAQPKTYTTQNVFNSVKIRDIDIQKINESSQIVVDWAGKCSSDRGRGLIEYGVYTQNYFNTSGYGTTHKVSSTVIHDLLRKISLSIIGHTTNSDIRFDEFELAQQNYDAFKNVWLTLYEGRLAEMEENK